MADQTQARYKHARPTTGSEESRIQNGLLEQPGWHDRQRAIGRTRLSLRAEGTIVDV